MLLVAGGALAIVAGLIVLSGGLSWFGRLPGDIRIEREGLRIYVPLVSLLLVSVVLTVLINLIRRWL